MKCIICHGEEIEPKEVSEEISNGDNIVRFNVTIPVCRTCGERYYDRQTMHRIEAMDEKLRNGNLPLREVGKVLACA